MERLSVLVNGYIRLEIALIPQDISQLITIFSSGKDGNCVIKSGETKILKSDYEYEFTHVRIEKGGILKVIPWDPDKKEGGRLLIQSMSSFIICEGGKIDLTSAGYKGGGSCSTGESYNAPSKRQGIHILFEPCNG